jgi:hypothetical protein
VLHWNREQLFTAYAITNPESDPTQADFEPSFGTTALLLDAEPDDGSQKW